MPEVAISKPPTESPAVMSSGDMFQPMFPFGRYFGLSPFAMMREFTDEMDRMFRGKGFGMNAQAWVPVIDLRQCNGDLVVSAELPGLRKDEVKVEVTDNALIIQGERKREHEDDHEGYHRWERSYGQFYRSVALPEGAKTDKVKAEMKDGVLKVSVPLEKSANNTRVVPVEAAKSN